MSAMPFQIHGPRRRSRPASPRIHTRQSDDRLRRLPRRRQRPIRQNFIAKPDANGTLAMCGACHQTQLAQFKSSRHFQSGKNQARLDCAECHGTHSVGNPPESFSYVQFCAGCHGLEYLPELPKQFHDLLTLVDEVRDGFVVMTAKGRNPSDEAIKQRRELRRLTAELVHSTERADRAGGIERIPRTLSQGERLKQLIKQHYRTYADHVKAQ